MNIVNASTIIFLYSDYVILFTLQDAILVMMEMTTYAVQGEIPTWLLIEDTKIH